MFKFNGDDFIVNITWSSDWTSYFSERLKTSWKGLLVIQ